MNDKIDIVVTYVNETDPVWKADFDKWKAQEIKDGSNSANNRQAFGEERIREWNTFKYWFRGVAKYCPWINRIHVVVANEGQVPKWLNTNNPKIHVVYHKDFMPEELLPNFNGIAISTYLARIPGIANNYIRSDDDNYILGPIEEDMFFKNNVPVHVDNKTEYKKWGGGNGSDAVFWDILDNNLKIEADYLPSKEYRYGFYHLMEARSSDFEKEILDKYENEFLKSFVVSKFRHPNNYCDVLFVSLLKICNKVIYNQEMYKNCGYTPLRDNTNFEDFRDKKIICFNDVETTLNFDNIQKRFENFLQSKFPNKCEFENEES